MTPSDAWSYSFLTFHLRAIPLPPLMYCTLIILTHLDSSFTLLFCSTSFILLLYQIFFVTPLFLFNVYSKMSESPSCFLNSLLIGHHYGSKDLFIQHHDSLVTCCIIQGFIASIKLQASKFVTHLFFSFAYAQQIPSSPLSSLGVFNV